MVFVFRVLNKFKHEQRKLSNTDAKLYNLYFSFLQYLPRTFFYGLSILNSSNIMKSIVYGRSLMLLFSNTIIGKEKVANGLNFSIESGLDIAN